MREEEVKKKKTNLRLPSVSKFKRDVYVLRTINIIHLIGFKLPQRMVIFHIFGSKNLCIIPKTYYVSHDA